MVTIRVFGKNENRHSGSSWLVLASPLCCLWAFGCWIPLLVSFHCCSSAPLSMKSPEILQFKIEIKHTLIDVFKIRWNVQKIGNNVQLFSLSQTVALLFFIIFFLA